MPQSEEDKKLIQKILSGDEGQLTAVIASLCEQVWNRVARVVRNGNGQKEDVQTILDDALIDLIKKVKDGSYDPSIASLSTLLYSIAKNKWLDILKRRYRTNRRETALNEDYSSLNSTKKNTIEEWIFSQEEKERIVQALKQLGAPCRELFELHYEAGMSLRTIAERLNISEDAVKQRHKRCKEKLRKIFGQDPRLG